MESKMDIQKEKEAFEAVTNIYHCTYNADLNYYFSGSKFVGDKAEIEVNAGWKAWQAAKAQAASEGFVLVPKTEVYDYYIANHLKGTTCAVDVSELTGNDGDRIYGKLRQYDCLGSDGNTLIYDLESSNFKLAKMTGNTGDYVLVPKESTKEILQVGRRL